MDEVLHGIRWIDRAEIEGLKAGGGFVLFIEEGKLSMLEGFSYGDSSWPTDAQLERAYYLSRDGETAVRDLEYLKKDWPS